MKKYLPEIAILIAVIALVFSVFGGGGGTVQFGRTAATSTTSGAIDMLALAINGSTTISNTGALSNITTASFSGAITVGGTLTVTGTTTLENLIQGGGVVAITASSTTITADQVCDNSVITWTSDNAVGNGLATATLPSDTALAVEGCLSTLGQSKVIRFRNLNSANASGVILVAGTDMDILVASGTAQDLSISGGEEAIIEFLNAVASTTEVYVESLIDGD